MNTKKTALAVLIAASVIASPAMAEEQRSTELVFDLDKAVKYTNEYTEKQNALRLKQLALDEAQIDEQLREIQEKAEQSKLEAILAEREAEWEQEKLSIQAEHGVEVDALNAKINALKDEIEEMKNPQAEKGILDRVFVTRISGIGNNMRARVYVDNNISTKRVGDTVIPGVKISRVDNGGVEVRQKGGKVYIPITTINRAHLKSFERLEEERKDDMMMDGGQYGSSSGAMPMPMPMPMPEMPVFGQD